MRLKFLSDGFELVLIAFKAKSLNEGVAKSSLLKIGISFKHTFKITNYVDSCTCIIIRLESEAMRYGMRILCTD